MASDNLQFVVPEATDLNDLQSKLQKVLGLSEVSSKTLEHTYYDSFTGLCTTVAMFSSKLLAMENHYCCGARLTLPVPLRAKKLKTQ